MLPKTGDFEEIRLPNETYDASKSSLEILCHTDNNEGTERWKAYRNYELQKVVQ